MTVKELIKKLQQIKDQDAIVCIEVDSNPEACQIKCFEAEHGTHFCYIGDDLDNLTYDLLEEYHWNLSQEV